MLDLHVLFDNTGSTNLTAYTTIPANDGAVVAGVPIINGKGIAKLVAWGAVGVDGTHGPKEVELCSNDLNDPANYSDWKPAGTSIVIASPHFLEYLPYLTAARTVKVAQRTANQVFTYTIDHYNAQDVKGPKMTMGGYCPPGRGIYSNAFTALTAGAWGTKIFIPTNNLPTGKYALLGCWVSNITNVMAIRFQHADFGICQPGFIVADNFTIAQNLATANFDPIFASNGFQFVKFSELLRQPECPIFSAGTNGTGLTLWGLSNTADTPTVALNLAYVGE